MKSVKLDLNVLVGKWDLSFTWGEKTFATKRIALAELAALASIAEGGDSPEAQAAKAAECFTTVFQSPEDEVLPWLESIPPEALGATMKVYIEYLKSHMTKNSHAIASAAAEAMAA